MSYIPIYLTNFRKFLVPVSGNGDLPSCTEALIGSSFASLPRNNQFCPPQNRSRTPQGSTALAWPTCETTTMRGSTAMPSQPHPTAFLNHIPADRGFSQPTPHTMVSKINGNKMGKKICFQFFLSYSSNHGGWTLFVCLFVYIAPNSSYIRYWTYMIVWLIWI